MAGLEFQLPLHSTLDQATLLGGLHNYPPKAHTPPPGGLTNHVWSAIESPISEASTRDVNTALETLLLPNDFSDFSYTADILYPQIDGNDQPGESLHQSSTLLTRNTDTETNTITSSAVWRSSSPQSPASNIDNSSKRRPEVRLRSASSKPKAPRRRKPPAPEKVLPPVPEKVLHARGYHNNAEKQYRTRLKLHFENLLAVIQAPCAKDAGPDEDGSVILDHCVSRGEVLDAARQRILALEEENKQLARGNDQLLKDMAAMHAANLARTARAK